MNLSRSRKFALYVLASLVCILIILPLVAWMFNIRFNGTSSAPIGLYIFLEKEPDINDMVIVRVSRFPIIDTALERGYLQSSYDGDTYLCKTIIAADGDTITQDKQGILYLNDETVQNSTPLFNDTQGRPIVPYSHWPHRLSQDQYFVQGDGIRSLDSRYFGPVNRSDIVSVVRPLLVFK